MDELKTIIRALAISNAANGITVAQLNKDFKSLEGYAIPYTEYGFQSLDGMLRTMTDSLQVNGHGLTAVVQPLTNEKSQHIREMVKKNKPDRKKHSANGYCAPQAKYRNTFHYNNHALDIAADDYNDDSFDDEIYFMDKFVSNSGTNDNARQQQHFHNGHGEEQQKSNNNSVYISPTISNDVNSQRQKKRDEILAKLLKQISTRTSKEAVDPDISKTPKEKINGMIDSSTREPFVPEDAMTGMEKIEEALPGHLKPNATTKVVVTSVLNPNHMHVHLVQHTNKLSELVPHIDNMYSTEATEYEWLIPDTMLKVGMYCAAKYHNRWYRAQVMGPVNFQRVLLSYIDYGYLRYVPLVDVRFLKKEFASIPCQAVHVALKYVKPSGGTWSRECCEQLANMVHRKVFYMTVVNVDAKEHILSVILTDSTNDYSIAANKPDERTVNQQLAKRSDVMWTAD